MLIAPTARPLKSRTGTPTQRAPDLVLLIVDRVPARGGECEVVHQGLQGDDRLGGRCDAAIAGQELARLAAGQRRQDRLAKGGAVQRVSAADRCRHAQTLGTLQDIDVEDLAVGEDPDIDGLVEGRLQVDHIGSCSGHEIDARHDRAAEGDELDTWRVLAGLSILGHEPPGFEGGQDAIGRRLADAGLRADLTQSEIGPLGKDLEDVQRLLEDRDVIDAPFGMNFQVLGPVLAEDVLASGPTGFGFLMAAVGLGAFVAAMAIAFAPRPEPRIIAVGAMALGVASIMLAASRSFPISVVAMLIAGGAAIGMAVTANSTIQMVVPDHLRGRTMSVFVTILSASVPLGGILIGGIASIWGVPLAFAIGGVVALLVGSMALIRIPRLLAASAPVAGDGGAIAGHDGSTRVAG